MSIIWKIAARVIDVAFNEINVAVDVSEGCAVLGRALNEAKRGHGGRE